MLFFGRFANGSIPFLQRYDVIKSFGTIGQLMSNDNLPIYHLAIARSKIK